MAGTLEELATNAYSANSNMIVDAGASLEFHGYTATVNGLSGAGAVYNDFVTHTQSFTVGSANGSGTFSGTIFSGTISGGPSLNLIKSGTGTQVFSGANNYAGSTTLGSGVLVVDNSAALGTAAYAIVFSGGTLGYTANSAAAGAQDYSSRFANSTKAINIDTDGQTVAFAGPIASSNTAGLVKLDAGTLSPVRYQQLRRRHDCGRRHFGPDEQRRGWQRDELDSRQRLLLCAGNAVACRGAADRDPRARHAALAAVATFVGLGIRRRSRRPR